ncbi:EcsC family protein [Vibrio breoganii]|uniref:EcsC family protein n=2 Tax=Vibrio breoganii TaxID=553239 RepID=UPI0021C317A0|nr:EcsC family protein [Vibrio breoganii]
MARKLISHNTIMTALDWSYDKAVNGGLGLDSAVELAESYLEDDQSSLYDQVTSLIRWQNTKSATSGFVTGLGGIIALPISIPTNITSVIFVQVRMIAAIAHMSGYDLNDDKVKTMVYACLTGNAIKELLKDVGMELGTKLAISAISGISSKTITSINQKVGFRLLTKFGEKGVINLGKAVPFVGGVIGGSVDLYTTNKIGNIARDIFCSVGEQVEDTKCNSFQANKLVSHTK